MNEIEDLRQLLKSHTPIIIIQSGEEIEALKIASSLAKIISKPAYGWSLIKGFSMLNSNGEIAGNNFLEPAEVLYYIYNNKLPGIFILLDFHPYLQNERNVRLLKELALKAEQYQQIFILVSVKIEVPAEIQHLTAEFEIPYPSEETIKHILEQMIIKCKQENPRKEFRIDEIFFIDLPDYNIRKEIFSIHLEKRKIDPSTINIDLLAENTEGFSGAEIEQVIVSGLYSEIGGHLKLSTEILSGEIKKTKPLSIVMEEKINGMRTWAADRTVSAN